MTDGNSGGPYRTAPPTPAPPPRWARFALSSARVRLGVDRFELSFWDWWPGLAALVALVAAAGLGVVALAPVWLAAAACAAVACSRTVFVVTRRGSWVEHRVARIPWARIATGMHPRIDRDGGWDFSELAIVPARGPRSDWISLAQWNDTNDRANREGGLLGELAERNVRRLHGDRPISAADRT